MKIFDKWAVNRVDGLLKRYSDAGTLTSYDRAFSDFIKNWGKGISEDYVGAVFNAIEIHGFYYSKTKFRLYQRKNDRIEEITDHPFLNLFKKPNSKQTWWRYAYLLASNWGLWGVNYFHLKRNIINGEVFGYQQIPPALIEKKDDGNYIYDDGVNKINISQKDMLEIQYPNPYSINKGLAIINTIADQAKVNALQMHYMKKFFENGGFMGLVFTTNQSMTPNNFKRTLEMLQEKFQGKEAAYREVGLFDNGLQPIKAAYSIKDMDITDSRKLTEEAIYSAWKVAKIMIGQGNMDRAGNDSAIYQFTSGIVDPLMSYVDNVFTLFVQTEWQDDSLEVIHDRLAPKDQDSALKYYESGLKNGWLTINEVREAENWNEVPYPMANIPTVNVGGALVSVDTQKQIGVEQPKNSNGAVQ